MTNNDEDARILIEHSDSWLANKGDLAMMDVTIRRLLDHWPNARIGIMTETPALLRAYFPQAEPITPWGRTVWSRPGLMGRLAARTGPRLVGPIAISWLTIRIRAQLRARSLRNKVRLLVAPRGDGTPSPLNVAVLKGEESTQGGQAIPPNTARAVKKASLVLALGGGYLTDADLLQSMRVLALLEHAKSSGTPAVMVGQGVGPIEDSELLSRIADVLPHVDFIALREARRGPELLSRAGVPMERIMVTGDDAIALAHSVRRDTIGDDIGICLRVAKYSPVTVLAQEGVKLALHSVATELRVFLVPVIISEYKSEDRRSTLPLVKDFHASRRPLSRFSRAQDVAVQIGGCRVLVTGAYHAAVFALAQGIPVVALSTSRYYDDKFLGLADMFGSGVYLIRLDADDSSSRVAQAIREAWDQAPHLRPDLRAKAEEQIVTSRSGVKRVVELVKVVSSELT